MRIVFLTPDLRAGGAERHWALLAEGLARRGFKPTVISLVSGGEFARVFTDAGVSVEALGAQRTSDPLGWHRAMRVLRQLEPAIIMSRTAVPMALGQWASQRLGASHVVNEHRGGMTMPRRRALLIRSVAPRVDRVIAIADAQLPDLEAAGYRDERILVIKNGVAPAPAVPPEARTRARAEVGAGPRDFLALLVAKLRPEKRIDDFIAAVGRAAEAEPRIRAAVAGSGPESGYLAECLGATGAPARLLGLRTDVPTLMSAADVVCLSSEAEGLPMALLEAMAASRPTISTDVGGVAEAVINEETGLLVPAGDRESFATALVRLARNPEYARELGAAGLARQSRHFDARLMIDAYAEALRAIASTRGRRPPNTSR